MGRYFPFCCAAQQSGKSSTADLEDDQPSSRRGPKTYVPPDMNNHGVFAILALPSTSYAAGSNPHMPTDDLLFTFAEVAVAFAGFAGLVTVLTRRDARSPAQTALDMENLQGVLAASLIVVAFSLLPSVVMHIGIEPKRAWRVASGAFCIAAFTYAFYSIPGYVTRYRAAGKALPVSLKFSISLVAVSILTLALSTLGIVPERFYPVPLVCYLYFAGIAFVRVFTSVGRDTPQG